MQSTILSAFIFAVVGASLGYNVCDHIWQDRMTEFQIKASIQEQKLKDEARLQEQQTNENINRMAQKHAADVDALTDRYQSELSSLNGMLADLRAQDHNSVPAGAAPSSDTVQEGTDQRAHPERRLSQCRAQLDQVSERLLQVSRDKDAVAEQLNAVIDAYETVRTDTNIAGS